MVRSYSTLPPRVSLALPVYNGEKFISESIRTILNQDYEDFELIITDNASTDRTEGICREFAASDGRIRYIRNEQNLGAGPNFNRGFELSSGYYFKWCACDDLLSPNFLGACVSILDLNQDAVLAYGTTQNIDQDGHHISLLGATMPDMEDAGPARRFHRFVTSPIAACYEIFGVFRRDALKKTELHSPYYGSDRALLAEMALLGRFMHLPDIIFYSRDHSGRSVNMPDNARALWQNTGTKSKRSLEHWSYLHHLIKIAIRYRGVAPPAETLVSVVACALQPRQLAEGALELINLASPYAKNRLRRTGRRVRDIIRRIPLQYDRSQR